MLNVIRRSQVIGSPLVENAQDEPFDRVLEIWSDRTGRATYLACRQGYIRLQLLLDIDADTVFICDRWLVKSPPNLLRLYRLPVFSTAKESLGWVEDFLFDWHTGEITAYIVGGKIASPFGDRAVLFSQDIKAIEAGTIVVQTGVQQRIKSEAEGLQDFLCYRSPQVQRLVKCLSDRLYSLISPDDDTKIIRCKFKMMAERLAIGTHCDRDPLVEATEFIQQYADAILDSLNRPREWAISSLETAWREIYQ